MAKLSSTAWILHNLGLATSIGGNIFGQTSMKPALHDLPDQKQRDRVSDAAWSRFSWLNIASHGIVAATWFIGRSRLSGREVSSTARNLTLVKDVLVVASVLTGVASVVVGKALGARTAENDRAGVSTGSTADDTVQGLRKAVAVLGTTNLVANMAIAATTTGLSMEASESEPVSIVSRLLP